MAFTLQTGGYVKFLRGTPAAWDSVLTKNGDTLYFICEEGAEKGKLYLGSKLISDGTINSSMSLGDLEDVLINAGVTLNNGSLLVYNGTSGKWEPQTLATVLSQIISVMTGATAERDGTAGLVPMPIAGSQNLYLRGDATWANPTAAVESTLTTLINTDSNKSIRTIAAEEVAKIVTDAPANLDTLGEIANWIQSIPDLNKVIKLTSTVEDILDDIHGKDRTNKTDGIIYDIATLNEAINGEQGINNQITTINKQITNIDGIIRWQDLVDDNT